MLNDADSKPRVALQVSNKENMQPDEPEAASKPKTATMWMQLQQMEQLKRQLAQEEKLRAQAETQLQENRGFRRSVADARAQLDSQAQEMEILRRQCTEAQDQAERYRARAQSSEKEAEDVKAKLLKEISQKSQEAQQLRASLSSMKAKASEEKPCSGQEIEQLRSKYEKVLQVLRGSQLAERNSELDFLKTQLQALQRQTDSNQQRVQAIEASKIKAAASPGSALEIAGLPLGGQGKVTWMSSRAMSVAVISYSKTIVVPSAV